MPDKKELSFEDVVSPDYFAWTRTSDCDITMPVEEIERLAGVIRQLYQLAPSLLKECAFCKAKFPCDNTSPTNGYCTRCRERSFHELEAKYLALSKEDRAGLDLLCNTRYKEGLIEGVKAAVRWLMKNQINGPFPDVQLQNALKDGAFDK